MDDIAIIGFAFKLPGGIRDEHSFWDVLKESRNVMTEYPPSRINVDAFYDQEKLRNNSLYARGAHFLTEDPAIFDAPFFMITKEEAASMDPQQRKLLEVSYHALENAGIPIEKAAGSETAVYASTMANDFERMQAKDPDTNAPTAIVGTSSSIVAGRLSWFFDFKGPCLHVDTACSSSLVALDLACQGLRNKASQMALVAGSTLILSPDVSLSESNMLFLSPDGLCKSFTSAANGYGRGEGVVVLILKRVTDAIADGDTIRAVIRGSGSNQDGRTPGIGRPSMEAQHALITRVYRDAGLDFSKTRFFEAHGTGTAVGDPIETKAIGKVFRTSRSRSQPLYIGSLKANIGHIEAGSGIASVIKAILSLERAIIPPNALFDNLNSEIDADFFNLKVPTSSTPWPCTGLRRVSVNSFGFGGSNAHVILDDARHYLRERNLTGYHRTVQYPPGMTNGYHSSMDAHSVLENEHPLSEMFQILCVSAKDQSALKRLIDAYNTYVNSEPMRDAKKLQKLAWTLINRRTQFSWRSFTIVPLQTDPDRYELNNFGKESARSDISKLGIAYIFTGQGAQYEGMGQELLVYPIFASTLRTISSVYKSLGADWDVIDEIRAGHNLQSPEYSQPICTALQLALFELLKSWKIIPLIVIGHSSGEIAAAYAIGALNLVSACKVAYWRGKLTSALVMSKTKPGAMISVNLSQSAANNYISVHAFDRTLNVACINSGSNVTISGPQDDIEELYTILTADNIQAFKVPTGAAYHSPAMEQISDQYQGYLGDLEEAPGIPSHSQEISMISTVTGVQVNRDTLCSARYWSDNMVSPVQFRDAVELMIKTESNQARKLGVRNLRPIYDIIEIGPHSSLRRPVTDMVKDLNALPNRGTRYWSVLNRMRRDLRVSLELPAHLFVRGYSVDITAVNSSATQHCKSPLLEDTPAYPFDTSQTYWSESRLSRDFRLRGGGSQNCILGIRASDWNPLEPRWRKFVSIKKMPWVADHVITGTPLFPASGMLIMAIASINAYLEINKANSPAETQLNGFSIKEALFLAPIVVYSRVELQTQLRPVRKIHEKSMNWFEVQIFAYTQAEDDKEGRWIECFKAKIQTQYRQMRNEVDNGLEARLTEERGRQDLQIAKTKCSKMVPKESFYTYHNEHGLHYGPRFQLVEDVYWDGDRTSIASVHDKLRDCPPDAFTHPATLDAAFQTCMTSVWSQATAQDTPTLVPHRMFDTFVSASKWCAADIHPLKVMTSSHTENGTRGAVCRVLILGGSGEILCDAKRLEISPVAGGTSGGEAPSKKMLYGIKWRPLLGMMDEKSIDTVCHGVAEKDDHNLRESEMVDFYTKLETALIHVIDSTLATISPSDIANMPMHMQYYVSWMQLHSQRNKSRIEVSHYTSLSLEAVWDELVVQKPSWKLFVTFARNLESIIRGTVDPLEYMFSTGEAEAFYADICANICAKLEPFLELTAHGNPKQRILEVGAGTGGMTSNILEMLRTYEAENGSTAFSQYLYTDISSAFFEGAKSRFSDFTSDGRLDFRTFNLDEDATAQGFQTGEYDVIVAGSVVHATSSIRSTLCNLRNLLKPGGKLVLLEITEPEKTVGSFVFGTLPGWWRGEDARCAASPAIDEESWIKLLTDTGFSGSDVIIRDWDDVRCHDFTLIVSTAVASSVEEPPAAGDKHIIFVTAESAHQPTIARETILRLDKNGTYTHAVVSLQDMAGMSISNDDIVVFLIDVQLVTLAEMDTRTFDVLKDSLLRSRSIFWVSTADPRDASYASKALSVGLLRSLRSEDIGKRIITLFLEVAQADYAIDDTAEYIVKVLKASFDEETPELEYVVRNGSICVPRLSFTQSIDTSVRAAIEPALKLEIWAPGPPLKLASGIPGDLESLRFIEDHEPSTELGPQSIEVEAKAWGLSFRDVFLAMGRLNEAEGFGFECAGVVRRVGSQCTMFNPGDRVCMTARGSMRQYPRCDEKELCQIPYEMSFEEAASMIGPALTAVYSLIEVARLRRNDKILIHSAAGATGQLAVMLAQSIGATVYCTVSSSEKKKILMDTLGIPEAHILFSRDTSFASGIMRLTDGYGVDVLLNSLSGDSLLASWDCMAPYGRFVEIGKTDIMANESLPMSGFRRNVSFSAIDFYHTTQFRKDVTQSMLAKAMLLVSTGTFSAPKPLNIYPASKIEQAFRHLQGGQQVGRTVIVPQNSDIVPKYLTEERSWRFASDVSYVIVGGFGGLGRAILPWMASKGAKHIIVLSRSGPTSIEAKNVLENLSARGVSVYAPKCDVSSKEQLKAVLEESREHMPPIKGCINAAMWLQDTLFHNMTESQWSGTVNSKLKSSMHLSELLPKDIDFFLLFSSLSGVYGTPGQSNYAAGCSAQDALARSRVCQGFKAISIDIGWMRTIGVVAESELYQRVREREADMQKIEEDEFLALLDLCCDPNYTIDDLDSSQILLGPVTPADIRAQGEEPPPILQRPLFAGFDEMHNGDEDFAAAKSSQCTPSVLFKKAETVSEKADVVVDALVEKVSRALAVSVVDIDTTKPLFEYGVDSLVALELRNWIVKEFVSEVAVFDIMGGSSIANIGKLVVERSRTSL